MTHSNRPRAMAMAAFILLAACSAIAAVQQSATAIDLLESLRSTLHQARSAEDWQGYLAAAKRETELLNGSPLSRLEVARAQMRLGEREAALSELRGFVHMGQSPELLETLPDFAPLRATPAFAAIRNEGAANQQPIARSALAFHLKDRNLLPEDIDFDSASQRFFISSVLQKKIVTATLDGQLTEFASSPDGWPVMALKIDHTHQLLWASEVAVQGFEGVEPSAQGRSALLCYDLHSGKLMKRIDGPRPTALGDMALSADGTVIVSDGDHGGIYRAHRSDDRLERIDGGDFISPQTVAIAADGKHMLVPDYVRGIGVLEPETKRVVWLSTSGRHALNGIDGLYRVGDRLIAVQNGVTPERVVIFSLESTNTRVTAENIIERSTSTLGDPTHGVAVGGTFYYIANSGWDVLDEHGKVKPGLTLTEPAVMKFKL